jgi:hypothetical protein
LSSSSSPSASSTTAEAVRALLGRLGTDSDDDEAAGGAGGQARLGARARAGRRLPPPDVRREAPWAGTWSWSGSTCESGSSAGMGLCQSEKPSSPSRVVVLIIGDSLTLFLRSLRPVFQKLDRWDPKVG